ncbi:DUF998 domain-containing protein [Robertkochia marina]|uniref:DUF998 domain-containing protein n=1 Tax=Robertkochia marina TaxID=1227945 RepID=A0A4S3LXZ2_9FLAO|nr:DUF998 domain-containing protein [Robertkochia marina]THD66422.1 DUF998 domain-containing protein [Robertkochia marina]TRZ44099.1 DUF998 domain-containing protein [Robertkochia marina]
MKKLTPLLLWSGLLAVLVRNILVYYIGWISPGYSPVSNFISELSADGMPYAGLVNLGSLIVLGIVLIMTALALKGRLPGPGRGLSMSYLAISGVAFIGIGLFPCPPGCRPELNSMQMTIHTLAGFIASVAICLSAIVYGLKYFKGYKSPLRSGSFVLGTIGILAFVTLWVTIVTSEFGIDIGLYQVKGALQRLNVLAGDLWVVLACVSCLRTGVVSKTPASIKDTSSTLVS